MRTPWPGLAIIGMYVYFVQTLGPRWMANKKPFNLDRIIQVYNVIQICSSAYLLWKALELGWLGHYKFTCQPVDYSMDPRALAVQDFTTIWLYFSYYSNTFKDKEKQTNRLCSQIAGTVWTYFIVKVIDLLDTIFFVLRKKQNQVSFLHVYHHAGMVVGGWAATKYLPGGHVTFLGKLLFHLLFDAKNDLTWTDYFEFQVW